MKKLIFLSLAFVIVLALAFYLSSLTKPTNNARRELIKELNPLECDLNIQACEYNFKGKTVQVFFDEKPLSSLSQTRLRIENLGDYKDLNARIYGLNMYMGDIVPNFEKEGQSYEATIVIAACVIDIMRFRVEFFDADEPLGFYFDFDVRR